jgi:uncharacterized protein (TIGR03083 family)
MLSPAFEEHAEVSVGSAIVDETNLLADAIRTAPHARVRKYPSWDLAQLGRHVAEIHGWATGIVRDNAAERPSRSKLTDVPDDEVAGVLHISAASLAKTLDACDLDAPVWTFGRGGTNAFWCRRMLLETTIHRWDAEDAIGRVTEVPEDVALDGIDECLSVYLNGALPGWSLSSEGAAVTASDGGDPCTISGLALDMWLLVMGRHNLRGLEVTGDTVVAERLVTALADVRGPA